MLDTDDYAYTVDLNALTACLEYGNQPNKQVLCLMKAVGFLLAEERSESDLQESQDWKLILEFFSEGIIVDGSIDLSAIVWKLEYLKKPFGKMKMIKALERFQYLFTRQASFGNILELASPGMPSRHYGSYIMFETLYNQVSSPLERESTIKNEYLYEEGFEFEAYSAKFIERWPTVFLASQLVTVDFVIGL